MSDDPTTGRARFLSAVEARYVALRGRGYMLSALDVARVERWYDRGVPLTLALRVLEDGVREYRRTWRQGGAPRTLAYFERQLLSALRDHADRGLASLPDDGASALNVSWDAVLARLTEAGRAAQAPSVVEILRGAWRQVAAARQRDDDVWALTPTVDAAIADRLMTLLTTSARREMMAAAERAVDAAGGARMSAEARQAHVIAERSARLRARFGVPELMEVLLEPDL